jgi:hypothetical protein
MLGKSLELKTKFEASAYLANQSNDVFIQISFQVIYSDENHDESELTDGEEE